jgi:hypothetical protein
MARFWQRGKDRSIEQLLRANRPEPRDEFAASVLSQVTDAPAPVAPRRTGSPRRFALALALTVVALGLAGVLGGITAATAGLGGIAHVATKAVTPSHTQSTTVKTTSSKNETNKGGKSGDNNGDKDGLSQKGHDNDGDDDDSGDHDGDHHQYKVGVCHWANHKYVLIFVSPQGAANHLKHHSQDKLPVNGHC